ncbi:MAG: response regulator transcription factor [Chloroflexota bacterium]|nr:response regulator transcription factor [Chloroflexota bacterium]
MSPKVRVVILEDEALYRDLLRIVLSQHSRLEVVGSFGDAQAAVEEIPALEPEVAVLDIDLGGGPNGIQVGLAVREKLPNAGIVLLSNHANPELLSVLPQDAISGWSYLLKRSVSDVEALERAIEGAAEGMVVLDPRLVRAMQPRPGTALDRLTPRQRDVLALTAQGFSNAAIAARLSLAEKSVENQINQLYQQLQIDRRQGALHPRVRAVLLYLRESRFAEAD